MLTHVVASPHPHPHTYHKYVPWQDPLCLNVPPTLILSNMMMDLEAKRHAVSEVYGHEMTRAGRTEASGDMGMGAERTLRAVTRDPSDAAVGDKKGSGRMDVQYRG